MWNKTYGVSFRNENELKLVVVMWMHNLINILKATELNILIFFELNILNL